MEKSILLKAWVVSLLLIGLGQVYTGHAQDSLKIRVTTPAASKTAALHNSAATSHKPVLNQGDSLEAYDRKRALHVTVLFVRNALTDDLNKSDKTLDSLFTLTPTTPYHPTSNPPDTIAFRLNDETVLYVRDLRLALRRYKRHKEDLRLYINDVPLPMVPEQLDTTHVRDVALVRFRLVRNSTTEPVWQVFYRIADKLDRHNVSFNVGIVDGQLGQAYGPINLLLINRSLLWVAVGSLLLLLGGCWWLTGRSNFIRTDNSSLTPLQEGVLQPGEARLPLSISTLYKKVPFSLAKTQTAFWILLIAGAYLMITAVTTALPVIPTGLLGLLGISVANGVFSKLINQSQPNQSQSTTQQVTNAQESRGWWSDVLTETAGVSLSRLQFLVFNGIAGLYFVYCVWTRWAFYDFGSDILALISISSAGFLANKNFENNSKDNANKPGPSGGSSYTGPTGADYGAGAGNGPAGPGGGGAAAPQPAPATDAAPQPAPAADAQPSPTMKTAAFVSALATPPPVPAPAPQLSPLERWRQNLQRFLRFPVRYNSDPTRDIFGNPGPAVNDCTLKVVIAATLRGGLSLQATVQCNQEPFSSGDVVFLLHPTYQQRALTVPLHDGAATLSFFSAGCFTLIAMLDAGKTILSFDLRDVRGAPSSFLAR